ncbi:TetR/AcrR family transcriptional regulator [Rhodobacterales bacterium]|nr:TetR/AcrR family transcriptional regulator [Rhodobacterales bacterium]
MQAEELTEMQEKDAAESGDKAAACRQRGRQKIHDEEELKSRIIEIAFKTFHEHSFKGTTMALIAKNVGISKRTLYQSFPSKIELFAELAIRHRSNLIDLPRDYDGYTLEETLRAVFKVDQTREEHYQRASETRLFYAEAVANPELGQLLKKHFGSDLHDLLAEWIEQEVERGRIVSDSPRDTAKYLLDVLVAARLFRPNTPDPIPGLSDIPTYLEHAIKIILKGLVPR